MNSTQVSGDLQKQISRPIRDLIRFHVEDQKRFPLQLATELSQQFTRQGLQFFKVNKTVTHVSVSRPHYLNLEATPVSETVKKIVQFIDETPDCTRVKVMDALAPAPVTSESEEKAPETPAVSETSKVENENPQAAQNSSSEEPVKESGDNAETTSANPEPETKKQEESKAEPAMTPEQAAVSTDLHWLIHQGHVIEFSNGKMETAKKPKEQPPKKQNKAAGKSENQAPAKESDKAQESNAETQAAPATSESDQTPEPKPKTSAEPAPSKDAKETNAGTAEEVKQTPEAVSGNVPQAEEKDEEVATDATEESKPGEVTAESTDTANKADSTDSETPATEEKPSDS